MKKINLNQYIKEANLTQSSSDAMDEINGGCIFSVSHKCGGTTVTMLALCDRYVQHIKNIKRDAPYLPSGVYEAL